MNTQNWILPFIVMIFLVAVTNYFAVLLKQLKKQNTYNDAQTKLLGEIAIKQGVDIDVVSDVLAQAGIKNIKFTGEKVG